MPLRRSTSAVPAVASTLKPRSASRFTGNTSDRLSRLATDTNTVPCVGSEPYAPAWDFANATPKDRSTPITSPVDFISGPSRESTPWPSRVRKRWNGRTASFTATGDPTGSIPPSPSAGRTPWARSRAIDEPVMSNAAAFASGTAVAFDTNGTVRDALGLASSTYRTSSLRAYWTLSRPRTPMPLAMASVERRTVSRSVWPSVMGGSAHAESPECTPASSMCSMTPPRYSSSPS